MPLRYRGVKASSDSETTTSVISFNARTSKFQAFRDDIAARLVDYSPDQKDIVLNSVDTVIRQYGTQISNLFRDAMRKNTLIEAIGGYFSQVGQKAIHPTSGISRYAIPLLSLSIPSSAMLPLFLALCASTTHAATADWTMNSGSPNGGADLCSGILFGCLQGYLTNGTDPWTPSMPQFSRVINQANSQQSQGGAYFQLRDCITIEKMGQAIIDILNQSPTGTPQTASVTTAIWQGYSTTFQATAIPASAANAVESADLALGTNCQNYLGALAKTGVIVGATVGAVAGVVVVCMAGFYFREKLKECINRCRAEDIPQPSV